MTDGLRNISNLNNTTGPILGTHEGETPPENKEAEDSYKQGFLGRTTEQGARISSNAVSIPSIATTTGNGFLVNALSVRHRLVVDYLSYKGKQPAPSGFQDK